MPQAPIKYGDLFNVSSGLAGKPVAPQDAAMIQYAESIAHGQTQNDRLAATMHSAAEVNERAGLVGHVDTSDVTRGGGITVVEVDEPGAHIFTKFVEGKIARSWCVSEISRTEQPKHRDRPNMASRTLELTVLSANDLKKARLFSKMDLYVVVFLDGDCTAAKHETPIDRHGGTSPTWNSSVKFTINEPHMERKLLYNFI
ncbi:hypothetical protein Nepgr_030253 [Nepenthes gracilis]|uniref:C2 domain-containing protein n=1 Tax=Nepenthes gracilis TaxID=150966 RepID=A0AAD3Y5M1_NEPGR|nr:hypothetical protein Nepgr_030253 [Nepenthes gracilis]